MLTSDLTFTVVDAERGLFDLVPESPDDVHWNCQAFLEPTPEAGITLSVWPRPNPYDEKVFRGTNLLDIMNRKAIPFILSYLEGLSR